MIVDRLLLRRLAMPLKAPFETSFGVETNKEFWLVEAHGQGFTGYAECVAMAAPYYNEETNGTALHIMRDFLAPALLGREWAHPQEVSRFFARVRRNNMAKSAVESACWDLWCQAQGVSLAQALGGVKAEIEVGVSVGIQPTVDDLIRAVGGFLEQGYRRIKVKIKPGRDLAELRALRRTFGDIPLMADANSAYRLEDLDRLKALDDLDLMMIEQPLAHDDIIDHARLQRELATPICLDESIHSAEDARKALDLGACRIINIKIGRVGGLGEALAVHDLCHARGVPVWCGGMLESGVGRAHNIALTALPGFVLPGDTSASDRYWAEDIVEPGVTMTAQGTIPVPAGPGLGYRVVEERVARFQQEQIELA